jgi:CubicO group peptidase (beta-lactamase class C family)
MRFFRALILFVFFGGSNAVLAQFPSAWENKLDNLIKEYYTDGFNGNILIVEGDSVLLQKSYGYSDLVARSPLNDSSVFDLASVSKQFTAFAVLKLVELKKISLSDSLCTFFPELPYKNVTVHHLLSHSSGIPYYEWSMMKKISCATCTNDDLLKAYALLRPASKFKAGTQYDYCNMNYVLLASIVEKISGMSYGNFLQQTFFAPLKMSQTYVGTCITSAPIPNFALGYTLAMGKYQLPKNVRKDKFMVKYEPVNGPKNVHSSAKDLLKWNTAIWRGEVLSKESLELACTSYWKVKEKFEVGYGLVFSGEMNAKVFYSAGYHPGANSFVAKFPQTNRQVIILSNRDNSDDRVALFYDCIVKGRLWE